METLVEDIEEKEEVEESEDYSTFFLQPASSPYNMKQKVAEANMVLTNTNLVSTKLPKVKFNEQLVTFDGDLTDDDVLSIESDKNDDFSFAQVHPQILSYQTKVKDIEEDEEIIDEIDVAFENLDNNYSPRVDMDEEVVNSFSEEYEDKIKQDQPKLSLTPNNINPSKDINPSSGKKIKKQKHKKRNSKPLKKTHFVPINCKQHCIEKIETNLSSELQKLHIYDSIPKCPPLKLRDRKCCEENFLKKNTALPVYNGYRSEYGLSSKDLKKQIRTSASLYLREEKRLQFIEEYIQLKQEVNEEIYSQWLYNKKKQKPVSAKLARPKSSSLLKKTIYIPQFKIPKFSFKLRCKSSN